MDELLSILPPSVPFTNNGIIDEAGLVIRYSATLKKWICGYGKNCRYRIHGEGDTATEAIKDLISKEKDYRQAKY